MNKKKTLLIFSPTIEDGGVEKNLYNISNFLSQKLESVYLLTANSNKKSKFNHKIKFISPKSYKWIHSNRLIKTFVCIYLFFNQIKNYEKNIMILSFNSNIFAIILAKVFRLNIIIRSNTSPYSYAKNFIKRKLFKLVFSFADEIIVNSHEFKKQIKQLYNLSSYCILNPLEKIENINKLAKKKIKFKFFKKNTLNLITIGRLVKQKNHLLILKAIKGLPNTIDYRLLIIGDGEEKEKLIEYCLLNNLKNVKILSYKSNPYPYIKKSDLFILSSIYEGLPNVLLEAMALKNT